MGEMYSMLLNLLSGLALFLFGMKFMSDSLQQAAGDKLRGFLDRCTKNKYVALLFGALFTAFIQSSGATTVMEVGFVNAGILTLEQSVGLTYGANIGTTITSQLVSLKLTAVAPFIIFFGAALIAFCKKPMIRKIADIIFGFGALFLGIGFMTDAMSQIPGTPLEKIFEYLDNPLMAIAVGLFFTVIVQSSSVTISVLVLLAGSGLVGQMACLYFILGANIGSCTPAVVASINANRNAKRTAFIHVMFNVIGLVVISVLLAIFGEYIIRFINVFSPSSDAQRFVANADTIFKIFQAVILLPFSGSLVKLSKKVIHAKKGETEIEEEGMVLKHIDQSGTPSVTTAVVQAIQEIERMADMTKVNLRESMRAFIDKDTSNSADVYKREQYIDYLSHNITEYMITMNQYKIPIKDKRRLGGLFHVVIDIERIGDHAVNIMEDALKEENKELKFTKKGRAELEKMFEKVEQLYDESIYIFVNEDKTRFETVEELEAEIDQMKIDYQKSHVKRMVDKKCTIDAGPVFTDLVIGLERVADHCVNIAYSILPERTE